MLAKPKVGELHLITTRAFITTVVPRRRARSASVTSVHCYTSTNTPGLLIING